MAAAHLGGLVGAEDQHRRGLGHKRLAAAGLGQLFPQGRFGGDHEFPGLLVAGRGGQLAGLQHRLQRGGGDGAVQVGANALSLLNEMCIRDRCLGYPAMVETMRGFC